MALLVRFLRCLGDDGYFVVKSLNVLSWNWCPHCDIYPLDLSEAGYVNFKSVSSMLLDCASLTNLRLTVSEHYLFRNDQAALENLFMRSEALKSNSLEAFRKTLQALPNLQNADIDVPREIHKHYRIMWHELKSFLRYVFTRERREKLWVMSKTILEGTRLQIAAGRIHVNCEKFSFIWE
jgi:hypothetical protein